MAKIEANARRDREAIENLSKGGWRVLVVWECAMQGPGRLPQPELLDRSERFIRMSGRKIIQVCGHRANTA